MKGVAERIMELLKESHYTQKELAAAVGVTEAAMSRYLSGEREPRIDVVRNLATALHTTTDYIISGREPEEDFDKIYRLVARGRKEMTDIQKMRLVKELMENV